MGIEVLAHRGAWNQARPKNSIAAFKFAFEQGFGVETDVRDYNGQLVISHDIPGAGVQSFDDFLTLYKACGAPSHLALNIKSDGLHLLLNDALHKANIHNYFVLDMSVPDGLLYLKNELVTFTRQSEFEETPSFYDKCPGVWLDEFNTHWITASVIDAHQKNGKVCSIVSPELHGRSHLSEWADYREGFRTNKWPSVMLCTDYPEAAQAFFEELQGL